MGKAVYNPFLPLTEYIPDGEPHVFGDRVYLYGSHDKAGSDRFCVQDYTVWSASVDDLTSWTNHGISYRKAQDLRAKPGKLPDYYAPDCVRGNDGRYYLYYVAMVLMSEISVRCRWRCQIHRPVLLNTWAISAIPTARL